MAKKNILQVVGAIVLVLNASVPMALDVRGVSPQWPWQYHALIGFVAFVIFIGWIIWDKQRRINELVSGDNVEVCILPNINHHKSPWYLLKPDRSISIILGLQIINHSENRKVYINKANFVLKRCGFSFRKSELFSIPVEVQSAQSSQDDRLMDIEIEPQSKTDVYPILVHSAIPTIRPFPRKSKLILRLIMIGLNRETEHDVETFIDNPKSIPEGDYSDQEKK